MLRGLQHLHAGPEPLAAGESGGGAAGPASGRAFETALRMTLSGVKSGSRRAIVKGCGVFAGSRDRGFRGVSCVRRTARPQSVQVPCQAPCGPRGCAERRRSHVVARSAPDQATEHGVGAPATLSQPGSLRPCATEAPCHVCACALPRHPPLQCPCLDGRCSRCPCSSAPLPVLLSSCRGLFADPLPSPSSPPPSPPPLPRPLLLPVGPLSPTWSGEDSRPQPWGSPVCAGSYVTSRGRCKAVAMQVLFRCSFSITRRQESAKGMVSNLHRATFAPGARAPSPVGEPASQKCRELVRCPPEDRPAGPLIPATSPSGLADGSSLLPARKCSGQQIRCYRTL